METQNPQEPEKESNKEVYGWVSVPVDVVCGVQRSDEEVRAALRAETDTETGTEKVHIDSSTGAGDKQMRVNGWVSLPVKTTVPQTASDEEMRAALRAETDAEVDPENVEIDHVDG